jgi:RimJ/RimL family protein N-acetyltransferase
MELSPRYPVLSERLSLRPLVAADTAALLAYRGRADVCRWVPFNPMGADDIAERLAGHWARVALDGEGQSLTLGVELTRTGELVGDVVLFFHSLVHRSGEIGYIFNPDYGGRGYATEAVRVLLRLAFDQLTLHRVIARIDARNTASAVYQRQPGVTTCKIGERSGSWSRSGLIRAQSPE